MPTINSNLPNTPEWHTIGGLNPLSTFSLIVSSDLSCSNHTTSIFAKIKSLLSLLYWQYYNYVESDVLKQLYISLVRPHLK